MTTKADIAGGLVGKFGMSKANAALVVDHVFDHVAGEVSKGNEVRIHGFGTFSRQRRAESEGRNPRTGEAIKIPAKHVPKFKPAKALHDALNP